MYDRSIWKVADGVIYQDFWLQSHERKSKLCIYFYYNSSEKIQYNVWQISHESPAIVCDIHVVANEN
jgi:hypothetical protein